MVPGHLENHASAMCFLFFLFFVFNNFNLIEDSKQEFHLNLVTVPRQISEVNVSESGQN